MLKDEIVKEHVCMWPNLVYIIFGVGILLEYFKTKFQINVVICNNVYLTNRHIFGFSLLFNCYSYVTIFVCIHALPYFSN